MELTYTKILTTVIFNQDTDPYMVKNVPCSVCDQTEEKLFDPEIVDKLSKVMEKEPNKYLEIPVYEFE